MKKDLSTDLRNSFVSANRQLNEADAGDRISAYRITGLSPAEVSLVKEYLRENYDSVVVQKICETDAKIGPLGETYTLRICGLKSRK